MSDIDIRGMDKVKTLIELLDKYQEQLPDDLKSSLIELADCDTCEFTYKDYLDFGGVIGQAETDFHTTEIISVNPILKRITYAYHGKDGSAKNIEFPERFKLGYNGAVFIQWGYE